MSIDKQIKNADLVGNVYRYFLNCDEKKKTKYIEVLISFNKILQYRYILFGFLPIVVRKTKKERILRKNNQKKNGSNTKKSREINK